MKFKITSLVITLLLIGSTLSAKTTITWWQFWTDPNIKPVLQSIVNEFEKENPDINVKMTDLTWANGHEKIAIAFASANAPDVVELGSDWIAEFASNNLLMDISSPIASDSSQYQGWGMATYKG
ncbi:MAG: extracellular solute-binding protein, partial [FCB group bacterium]|nr:extracellular solute-binding protein [FCB group bacterium]